MLLSQVRFVLLAMLLIGLAVPAAADPAFAPVGTYATGLGDGSAEIVAVGDDRMYVTNSDDNSVDVVDIGDPTAPTLVRRIDGSPYGAGVTSVSVRRGYGHYLPEIVAVSFEADPPTDPGQVVTFDRNGNEIDRETVGALPDMLTFSPNRLQLLVANEGEPDDGVDPEGSVSVLYVNWRGKIVFNRTIEFTDFNAGGARAGELSPKVRIFTPGASVAEDLEPEYIAVKNNGTEAYVSLQENNAIAVLDMWRARVKRIVPLGMKDHSKPRNGLDASDRDDAINIQNWPVMGMYQPDSIAYMRRFGRDMIVTANEGDARGFEEARIKDATLDPTAFPNAAALQEDEALGRLEVSITTGDTDGDGDQDELHVFGARSFSIFTDKGQLIFDSGDRIEKRVAAVNPAYFNSDNDENTFDTRSDAKGPEPEAIAVGRIGWRTYAFVGLERVGGIMIWDITNPWRPRLVQYTNNRDFEQDPPAPDSAPEGIVFVDAWKAPNYRPTLVVANEVSGTVTLYQTRNPDGADRLTLLHNNDGESALLPQANDTTAGELPVGGVSYFKTVTDREIADARSAGNSVVNVYAGDAFLASATLTCNLPPNPTDTAPFDSIAQRQIRYDAHGIGNHEFDFGPDFLERFVRGFEINGLLTQPFLSANLDFSREPGFEDLTDRNGLLNTVNNRGPRVIARSAIVVDDVTGSRYGIAGSTTPTLPSISSPGDVMVTADLDATATAIQKEINRLQRRGVKKIILVSHLQDLDNDREIVSRLRGVDVAVAGGGDERLTNPNLPEADQLLPGDGASEGTYPMWETDLAGRDVPIVTTTGNYKYVGRLDLVFDAWGELVSVDPAKSFPRRVVPISTVADTLGLTDQVGMDDGLEDDVITPVNNCLAALATPVATTEILLNVSRSGNGTFPEGVRTAETNSGNMITDGYLFAYDTYAAGVGLAARGPANPVIAVQNGGGIRQNGGDFVPTDTLVPGDVTRRNTLDVLAFPNTVVVVSDVTPADLKEIMERSVSALPGSSGAFLQIAGFRVDVDTTGTAQVVDTAGVVLTPGTRIRSIQLDDGTFIVQGGVVQGDAPNVRIVTNNFTAGGGDRYRAFADNPNVTPLPISYEQSWLDYFLSFPGGGTGLPTLPATDTRYQAGGEGRISVN